MAKGCAVCQANKINTHHQRPRLHQGGFVYSLQRNHNKQGSRKTIPSACLPPLRHTKVNDHRQRITVHINLHEKSVSSPRDKTEYIISILSTDQWTIGAKQSMGRAVPPTLE